MFVDTIQTVLKDNILMRQSENAQNNQLIQMKVHAHQIDHFGIL